MAAQVCSQTEEANKERSLYQASHASKKVNQFDLPSDFCAWLKNLVTLFIAFTSKLSASHLWSVLDYKLCLFSPSFRQLPASPLPLDLLLALFSISATRALTCILPLVI